MTDWNEDANVGLTYKGYFTIYDGATPFRYKSLITVTVITAADSEKYYDDDGKKRKKSLGDSSSFELTVKKSADLVPVGLPPYTGADLKTISNFQEDIMNGRIIPSATFEGVQETEAATNKFMVARFTGFVENIDDVRDPSTGVPEVTIGGEIETWVSNRRQALAPT